ncbi:MAG: segregation/condensation protein A [Actinobacteria bacterium]|nr:segregation/condensation protein A [Actinomycetota bacterium]
MRLLDLDLEVYQGPFDLLFTLILREEVDIFEVPIVEVILAYVEGLADEGSADWEGLTEFLVLISSLLELKSRVLLPEERMGEEDQDLEMSRELLLARLVAYRRFKLAAAALAQIREAQRGRIVRRPCRESRRMLAPRADIAGSQQPGALTIALERLFEARRPPDTSHVPVLRVGLNRQIAAIRRMLRSRGAFSFEEEFGADEPMVQAVSLLALLGLMARGDVRVVQRNHFGDITVAAARARRIA